MTPIVSVIIPCYKQARFLPDAVDSVLGQSIQNLECIIINDGSPDNTREVAKALVLEDTRIRYIEQENRGLSGARNSGLIEAKGELIQFLDADDKLESDKLKVQADFLKANPAIDIVFVDARYFTTDRPDLRDYGPYAYGKEEPWVPLLWHAPGTALEKVILRNLFPVNSPIIRREVFEVVGGWNEHLKALEDWEFWLRCAAKNIVFEFLHAPNSLALIRIHEESMTRETSRMDQAGLEMRISVGPVIRDPILRLNNFEKGLNQLRFLAPANLNKGLFELTRANLTPKGVLSAARFFIIENFRRCWLARAYKRWIPWPIQKLMLKPQAAKRMFIDAY